jgi:uncharacterized membrane protein
VTDQGAIEPSSTRGPLLRRFGTIGHAVAGSAPGRLVGRLCEPLVRESRAQALLEPAALGDASVIDEEPPGAQGAGSGLRARLASINYTKVFLVVGLVWGLVLVFLVPPLQNFDELSHYYRAWSVAEGQLQVPAGGIVPVPRSVADLPAHFPYVAIATHQQKPSTSAIRNLIWQPITGGTVPSSSFAADYFPLGYVPQATGITLARLMGHSPLLSIYLGRLANLLVSLMLVAFALKLLPYGRAIMFVLALFPLTMLQMASLSPDALLISGTFFFVALALHYSQKLCLDWMHGIALALTAALVLNAKPGYAALSLLVFVIPPSRFASRSRYFATVAATIGVTVVLAGLIMVTAPDSSQVNAMMLGANNKIDPGAQVANIVHHPLTLVRVLDTTMGTVSLLLARNAVGDYAWGQLPVSDSVAIIGWLAVLAVLFLRERVPIRPWQRLVLIGLSLLGTVIVTVGLYVTWTPVGGPSVLGIQGRYYYPFALMGLLGVFGFPFRRRWVVVLVVALAVAFLIESSLKTLVHYYY